MVSFLYPAFLAGAVAVAVPIVLHLLTREAAPRVPFSAVIFLKRVPVEDSRRRLRELLLLALRVAALLLLAFAFARPFLTSAASLSENGVTVIAVDMSFSMGGPGRFEQAKKLARDAVTKLGGRVGVIAFADAADLVASAAGTPGEALAAIDRLQPGFGATRYAPALALASEQIGNANGRIVLVTDLQKQGWDVSPDAVVPSGVVVDIVDIGAPPGNLAVADVRLEDGGIAAVIRNTWPKAIASRARLTVDGESVSEMPVMAPPAVFSEVRFPVAVPRTGVAAVTIDDRDGYAADNARYVVLDPPAPRTLLVVTVDGTGSREAFYLSRALTVDARAFEVETVSVDAVAEMPPDRLSRYRAVVLVGTRGFDRRGRDRIERYVESGGASLVVAGPEVDLDAPARILNNVTLTARASDASSPALSFAPTDARHPIFRSFGSLMANLGQVRFNRSVSIEDAPGAKILARFSGGKPAFLEYELGLGRLLYFASDLNRAWNDFPIHPTFVPFVQETLRYLTATRDEPREYLVADVPMGVRPEPGIATIPVNRSETGETQTRRVAVNVDARESDPARIAPEQLMASLGRVASSTDVAGGNANLEHEERQRWWQYGLALMLVSLVVESALARRM